jgi:hypothetical protein
VRQTPVIKDVNTEGEEREEATSLEAVTRKPVRTRQIEKT